MYGEDIDLSYRIIKSGYKNYYYSDTEIIHFKGESTVKDKKYADRFYKAMIQFADKHYSQKGYGSILKMLISIGIIMAKFLSFLRYILISSTKELKGQQQNVCVMQDYHPSESIKNKLDAKYICKSVNSLDEIQAGIVLFPIGKITFKLIIDLMSKHKNNFQYRFLDEEKQLLIGSDTKQLKGSIERF
jgi:hypothetical protein